MRFFVSCGKVALLLGLVWLHANQLVEGLLVWHDRRIVSRAAQAGAMEACLPQATRESVGRAVERALIDFERAAEVEPPIIRVNGQPELLSPLANLQPGDTVNVTLGYWQRDYKWFVEAQGQRPRVD